MIVSLAFSQNVKRAVACAARAAGERLPPPRRRAEADADVSVELGRVGLSDDQSLLREEVAQRAVKGPQCCVATVRSARRLQHLAPARQRALAHLVAAQRPEQRAGGAPTSGGGALALARQLGHAEAEPLGQVCLRGAARPHRVEGAVGRDLARGGGNAPELRPWPGAELVKNRGKGLDTDGSRVRRRNPDGEVQPQQHRAGLNVADVHATRGGSLCADGAWRVHGVGAVVVQPRRRHPALVGTDPPVGVSHRHR